MKVFPLAVILTAVLSTSASAQSNPAKERAIAAIKKLGGTVGIDENSPITPVSSVFLSGTKITDNGLVHLKGLTNLRRLILHGTRFSDAGMRTLEAALPKCSIAH